ncbi:MAG: M20/M25/M40 family metallo-hydrolase [Zestosphaera sp.]
MDVTEILKKLISVKSLPGDEGDVAGLIKDLLSAAGVDKVFIDGMGNVIAPIKGNGLGTLVLEGHMDTVDAGDLLQWEVDPFRGMEVDGKIYGRGAVDMKGALASQIKAIEGLKTLESDLYIVYTVLEEMIEGVALGFALSRSVGRRPDVMVTGEPTGLKLGLGHRGRAVVNAEIRGETAHASMPSEGVNALEGAASLILRIADLTSRLPRHEVLGSESAVATLIECSPKMQPQIPDKCTVMIDHRIIPGRSGDDILKPYEELCSEVGKIHGVHCRQSINEALMKSWTGVEVRVKEFFPGWVNDDIIMIKALLGPLKRLYGGVTRHYWRFSTDLVIINDYNAEGLGLGPGDDTLAHKANECVDIIELRKAVDMYRELLNILSQHISSRLK